MKEMQDRLEYIVDQYVNQTASQSEEDELFVIINEAQHDSHIKRIIINMMQTKESLGGLNKEQWEPVLRKVLGQEENNSFGNASIYKIPAGIHRHTSKRKLYLKRWVAAASILILFSSGWYFRFSTTNNLPSPFVKIQQEDGKLRNDLPPGRNQAILTLADGSKINLDSAKNGILIRQGNIKIIKSDDRKLLYYTDKQNSNGADYNTISTPRGGKYEIVLPDGSNVWLNAASSLKFPTSFRDKSREVTLTGEGYFEVVKNASMPFYVRVNDMTVEVLGTHFNVNAYDDENSVATTLLEGSVKLKKGLSADSKSQTIFLEPGQQAGLTKDGGFKIDHHANMKEVIAWKEDNFEFNNAAIPAIMRQISRWYNVDVVYEGSIPDRRLTGKFSRNINLSQLINMLQYTGVNMKIENKKIIISEK
jgi:transmembrane sensor